MSQQGDIGQVAPPGGGDELGDIKIKRGGGVLIPIVFILALLGVGAAAFWYFAVREDPTAAHVTFRREIFGKVHNEYYNEFWACALNEPLANFSKNTELMAKIRQNGAGGDAKRYGQHLLENERCLPWLAKGMPEYAAIKGNPATPADYHQLLDAMSENLEQIKRAWTEFAQFQVSAEDRTELHNRIKARGEHWVGYQSSVNNRVPEKIAVYTPNAVVYYQFLNCVLGDREMTTFVNGDGESAQEKLLAVLDQQCAQNRAAFVDRLQNTCRSKLWPEVSPEPDGGFQNAIKHWSKNDNDFGSAMPMIECLEEAEEDQAKVLVGNIAKAWFGFSKTYRELIELSKSKSGSTTVD